MIIYKSESAIEGLADKILASHSIAYDMNLEKWTQYERQSLDESFYKSVANYHSVGSITDSDLYFTKSVFVSTNWNKNGDVFAPEQVWAARNTPSHKRTNLEHDEKQLVGHITNTWAFTSDGSIIPDNSIVDDLPDFYHLANGAVIYVKWEDESLANRTNELIEKIEAGEKFVSMEALFSNFGYAIITPEEEQHVIARSKDTAFLTKHLRCYGGDGTYDGCKIGRLLQNITFCGKGYVDRPANPYSKIFNDNVGFDFASASEKNIFKTHGGVFIPDSCTKTLSSDKEESNMDPTLEALKAENAKLQEKVAELTQANSESKVAALEEKVSELQSELDTTKAEVQNLTEAKNKAEEDLGKANEAKASLEQQIADIEAEKVQANRVSTLVEGGYTKDEAEKKVSVFASFNDEQFGAVAEELIAAKKMMKEDEEDDEKSKKSRSSESTETVDETVDATEANEEVLEAAEVVEEPNLTAEANVDDTESVRDELRKAIAARLGYADNEDQE